MSISPAEGITYAEMNSYPLVLFRLRIVCSLVITRVGGAIARDFDNYAIVRSLCEMMSPTGSEYNNPAPRVYQGLILAYYRLAMLDEVASLQF